MLDAQQEQAAILERRKRIAESLSILLCYYLECGKRPNKRFSAVKVLAGLQRIARDAGVGQFSRENINTIDAELLTLIPERKPQK